MSNKELAKSAHADSLTSLMLARDMVENAEFSQWKWALFMAIVESIVKGLWAIYFSMSSDDDLH